MALEAFPDAQTLVRAHRYDVARRAHQRHDGAVVRLNAVHAGAGQQFPHAEQAVLRARATGVRLVVVDEEAGDGAAMAVQREQQLARVQLEYLRKDICK